MIPEPAPPIAALLQDCNSQGTPPHTNRLWALGSQYNKLKPTIGKPLNPIQRALMLPLSLTSVSTGIPPSQFNGYSGFVEQLGQQTRWNPSNGLVLFNDSLVKSLSQSPASVTPALARLFETSTNPLQVFEGLQVAQAIAKQFRKTPNQALSQCINQLFTATSRFHHTTDPYLQTFLAGFYRYLDGKAAMGPLLSFLVQNSLKPSITVPFNANEEIGGALLEQIATHTTRQLLQTMAPRPPLPMSLEV